MHDYIFILKCKRKRTNAYVNALIFAETNHQEVKSNIKVSCTRHSSLFKSHLHITVCRCAGHYIYSNFFPCWQKGVHLLQLPLWLWPVVRRRWWKKGRIAHWLPNNNPNNDGSIFSPRNADAILWNSLKSTHELPRPENCLCPYLQQVMIINKTEKMEN